MAGSVSFFGEEVWCYHPVVKQTSGAQAFQLRPCWMSSGAKVGLRLRVIDWRKERQKRQEMDVEWMWHDECQFPPLISAIDIPPGTESNKTQNV
ncbi:uncharacterized protein ACNS7B_024374 isoform 2-T2 [Menidia menidia]